MSVNFWIYTFLFLFQSHHDVHRLIWSDSEPLKWSDFQGEPNTYSKTAALTSSGIQLAKTKSGDSLYFIINSYFDKRKSWVNSGVKNDYILNHEQGHFTISEIHARRLRKALLNPQFKGSIDDNSISSLYKKQIKELNQNQELYDLETNHSINKEMQQRWDSTLSDELKDLESYANAQFSIIRQPNQ
jgi:hypothetical protein